MRSSAGSTVLIVPVAATLPSARIASSEVAPRVSVIVTGPSTVNCARFEREACRFELADDRGAGAASRGFLAAELIPFAQLVAAVAEEVEREVRDQVALLFWFRVGDEDALAGARDVDARWNTSVRMTRGNFAVIALSGAVAQDCSRGGGAGGWRKRRRERRIARSAAGSGSPAIAECRSRSRSCAGAPTR